MKLIHLADLHIGKRVNEFSMLEDQEYILRQILQIIEKEEPDAILIAGDVYDKPNPSEEAVRLFDWFLTTLSRRGVKVFVISGNHDSATKLSFAHDLIHEAGIYIGPKYDGKIEKYTFSQEEGRVNLYLMPFIKPMDVKHIFKEQAEEILDYTTACKVVIEHMQVDPKECNILLAHQFVTGASRSDSEEASVGGLDNVDGEVFDCFDYVALGHIHRPQQVGRPTMRYSGTPLKYSFSEANHHKSVTVVEVKGKEILVDTIPLVPKRDLRIIKGRFEEIVTKENYEGSNQEDYIEIILTDEEEVIDAMAKLRIIYPNIMKLSYDNQRTRDSKVMSELVDVENKTEIQLLEEFFELQNNMPMTSQQKELAMELIEQVKKGEMA